MEPIRVLQVVGRMGPCGLETLIMNWYRKMDRQKVQFDFLVHHEAVDFYEEEIANLGGKIYRSSVMDDKNFIRYRRFLKNFFREHPEYRIVHGHHMGLGVFYFKAAKKAGVPVRIAHSHNSSYSKTLRGWAKNLLTKKHGKYANYHFACSTIAGDYVFGRHGDYEVINNGIDTEIFRFRQEIRDRMRQELGVENKKVIIHVGRFYDQKNHVFLIDIFRAFYDRHKDAVLLLVGEGPLEESIRKKVMELGLEAAVQFLGVRDDVQNLLCAADLFVLPSLYEGLSIVTIEAQAMGLPEVMTDNVPEEARLTDCLIRRSLSDSVSEWARSMEELLAIAPRTREEAWKIVKDKGFDSDMVAQEIQQFYLEHWQ